MRPFTTLSYWLIAVPIVLVVFGDVAATRKSRPFLVRDAVISRGAQVTAKKFLSWWFVVVLAVALEAVALALGGRSKSVPTLSTTLDRLLTTHADREIIFLLWLFVGALPLVRRRHLSKGSD